MAETHAAEAICSWPGVGGKKSKRKARKGTKSNERRGGEIPPLNLINKPVAC